MWKPIKSEEEIDKLFNDFIIQYGFRYPIDTLKFIFEEFYNSIGSYETYSIIKQLYSELGICSEEDDIYYNHFEKIKRNFDLGCNVLDLSFSRIPTLANIIAKHQLKIGTGTITCYNPSLIYDNKYPNMRLCKEQFNDSIDISKYDLITSLYPCEASETVIEQAIKNKKDFYIALCGCNHFKHNYNLISYQDFLLKYTSQLVNKYDDGKLYVELLDEKFELPHPIVYNKKK